MCVCGFFFFGGGVTFSFCSTQALHIEPRHVILLIQTQNNMGVGGWEWGGGFAGSPPPGITPPTDMRLDTCIHVFGEHVKILYG